MQCAKMWRLYLIALLHLTTLTSGEQPRIIIIGAGPSGIAAASKLFENGFDNVTVLEAENRIGGRVYSTWFDESWVDLGGQWVQGQINNTVFELASPLGLLDVPDDNNRCIVYTSQGDQIPTAFTDQVFQPFYDAFENSEDFIGNNGSVGEYFTRIMKTELEKFPTINETLAGEFMTVFDTMVTATESADNWYELSMRGLLEYQMPPGSSSINWKDRAYGTILDVLMKKYPNPEDELPVLNNTLLNSEVININYDSIDGKVLVKTSDGMEYVADHVITTMSLGVLKENYETLFTPQLPEYKIRTIKNLGFGTIAKVYLSYEAPWWPADTPAFVFIWDHSDRQEYENDLDKKWLLGLNTFTTVAHRPRLLCGWLFGADARSMENVSEGRVFNQTVGLLDKFLGKSYNITRPTGMLRTQWHNQKHFRGTYSFRGMESERNDVWAADLVVPLLVDEKPIVMFAGEATNPHHYATVDGAVETGFREANRLIDLYKNKSE